MPVGEKRTPYFEIDLQEVQASYRCWKQEIENFDRNDRIAYSVKANYDMGIIQTLDRLGGWFEICTRFEYDYLVKQGIEPSKIIVNGTVLCKEDLERYFLAGALVIIDSEECLQWACEHKGKCKIGVRCNLDYIKRGDEYYVKESRFGFENAEEVVHELLRYNHVEVICLQAHFSGNSRSPRIYGELTDGLCQLIKKTGLSTITMIDIGGGYKVAKGFWSVKDYIEIVNLKLLKHGLNNICVVYEPGNALVRSSVVYTTKVVSKRYRDGKNICTVDGSALHLPHIKNPCRSAYDIKGTESNSVGVQSVVGCTCKESDVLLTLVNDKELKVGSEIVIYDLGAYVMNEIPAFLLDKPRVYYK